MAPALHRLFDRLKRGGFLLVLLVAMPVAARPSAAEIADWWTGTWDNAAQLAANAALGLPPAPEITTTARRIPVERLAMPQLGEHVVLLQEYKAPDMAKANRSRVYVLRAEADGRVRAVQHFFTSGPTYDREPVDPAAVVRMQPKDFTLVPTCDLFFVWDAKHGRYHGAMAPRACEYRHETDGMVYAEFDQFIWPGHFWYRDRSVKIPSGVERGAIDGFQYLRFAKQ
jgi:CpeT/CpcT family (DUF1001)